MNASAGLRYAYNTNGLQSHRLSDAMKLLRSAGYDGIALTLDHMHLDPFRTSERDVQALQRRLEDHGLAVSIECGARFLLDPRRKHRPSWFETEPAERARRTRFLQRAIRLASLLDAESVVTFATIAPPELDPERGFEILVEELGHALQIARRYGVELALEPEPGHFIETVAGWQRLRDALPELKIAVDVGHVPVSEPGRAIPEVLRSVAPALGAVHIEDTGGDVHEHLPFGEGALDFPPILAALIESDYRGLVAVELSRDSHRAHELVPRSIKALREYEATARAQLAAGAGPNAAGA